MFFDRVPALVHHPNLPLGSYLKQRRQEVGLSQSEVARELGYSSPQLISNWERQLCHPPLSKLNKITKLYRIKSTQLIELMVRDYENLIQSKARVSKRKTRNGLRLTNKSVKLPDVASRFFICPTNAQKKTPK